MNNTPRSERLHIAIFGKRNVGKSSLINALTNQELSLVSDIAGTTTDPVAKSMELLPIGPVVLIDTAGFDDEGELGKMRVAKTNTVSRRTDVAVVVTTAESYISAEEILFVNDLKAKSVAVVCVVNKIDMYETSTQYMSCINKLGVPVVKVSAKSNRGIEELKDVLIKVTQKREESKYIVRDLIKKGDVVVLVTPIDSSAPKGRLILPQQQTVRDILDGDAIAVVTKENTLEDTLQNLKGKVAMVITDSQAFKEVNEIVPKDILLTSFSILFARYKGELKQLISGVDALYNLEAKDKVLIVEGCTHHRQEGDIGKVKIPMWIERTITSGVEYEWASGNTIPDDISKFKLIIHCGGCMLNAKEMKYRLEYAKQNNVPITNYGILIAKINGILDRALEPILKNQNILDNNML